MTCSCTDLQSEHQARVLAFMRGALQEVPSTPKLPGLEVRALRARLILEEALETVQALGFDVMIKDMRGREAEMAFDNYRLQESQTPDLVGVVDGCADVSVVTIGTLIACGVNDRPILTEVDNNNLAKIGPGHSFREDGKLLKPKNHQPPDLLKALKRQGYKPPRSAAS